jgi:flagellar hook-basal body complex protein FliE
MELKLQPFDFQQAVARAGLRPDGVPLRAGAATTPSFQVALGDALRSVSESQNEVARLQREFSLDNPSVSLEQVMISSEKARLGFSAAVGVRNRLVQAYTEIMNMQV